MSSKLRSIAKARARSQAKDGQITLSLSQALGSVAGAPGAVGALDVLLSQNEIPIRQSFLISKITKSLNVELQQYQESRKSLCERLAKQDSEGKPMMVPATEKVPEHYDIPAEKIAEFEKAHQELLATEVSIPGVKVKIGELVGVKIAPMYLMALDWLIEE